MQFATPGSISHGTLRTEDLLASFADVLEYHVERNTVMLGSADRARYLDMVCRARALRVSDPDGMEAADLLNERLFDALNDFAPPNHYFGGHEGDGSDFGFWPCGPWDHAPLSSNF